MTANERVSVEEIVGELGELIRIESVSTDPAYTAEVHRAAEWVAGYLREAGLEHTELVETAGHPLVYADWLHAPGKPTVLIYGHYDVQPADPLDQWDSPPFEPTVRDGNIYARGAADDKGQLYIHMKAVARLLAAEGGLPVNVRFLIEGEEESGGHAIDGYVRAHAADLSCDMVVISDSPMFAAGRPTVCTGLRGMVFTEIFVQTARHDLHSGLYGGAAPNAINILCGLLAALSSPDGRVALPGFYDQVRPLSEAERAAWATLPFDAEALRRDEIGTPALLEDAEYTLLERMWGRPTYDVNGINGGYTAVGAKAIIPAQASAKISFRLVPDQDPQVILASLEQFLQANCPPGATLSFKLHGLGRPVIFATDVPAMRAVASALEEVFGRPPVFTRMGGSIPIVPLFQEQLDVPCVMLAFGLPDDNLHAPNEKMSLANIQDGIAATTLFLRHLAEMGD